MDRKSLKVIYQHTFSTSIDMWKNDIFTYFASSVVRQTAIAMAKTIQSKNCTYPKCLA